MLRDAAFRLTRKHIREETLDVEELRLSPKDLSYFCLSTNQLISFHYEGNQYFFRECPRIQPSHPYFKEACIRFFKNADRMGVNQTFFCQEIPIRTSFDKEEITSFKAYIDAKMQIRDFEKRLKNADRIFDKLHFSIWNRGISSATLFDAFDFYDIPKECNDIAVYFLWNMRSAAKRYRTLFICRGKKYSFFSASRAVASQIVASELNLEHLITPVTWCRIVIDDGTVLFGILSPAVAGTRMKDIVLRPTPYLQSELICLNILDAVCYQPDHGPNNYNVDIDDSGKEYICAFDNDNPKTFFPYFTLKHSLSGCAPLVDIKSTIQRPHMDIQLSERLRHIDYLNLRKKLKPYLNELQIAAVIVRLHMLKKAIKNTQFRNPKFLLDSTEWDMNSVEEEMLGFKNTYLQKAVGNM